MSRKQYLSYVPFAGIMLFALFLSACNFSSNSAALTVTAAMTNLTETAKAAPTAVPTIAPTQPVAPPPVQVPPPQAPVATEPPAPTGPTLTALENTNCRMGADPIYPATGAFIKNSESKIIGTNENGSWWLIEDPAKQGQNCWVWGQTTQVSGDTSQVPYIPSPALPADIPLAYPTP